jgi:hypothetical protein
MRLIQLLASSQNAEAYTAITTKLRQEYGEPVIEQRSGTIPMEEGAWEKLRRLHG